MKLSGESKPWLPGLATLALGLAQAAQPQEAGKAPTKPGLNLLLIVAEGLGTPFGSPGQAVKTPNIDRLAGLGRRFDRAYVQYPLGGPARVSLMTGWRPETTGAFRDKASLREHARTLTPLQELLHDQGYYTVRVGEVYGGQPEREMKWDLVAEPTTAAGGAEWAAARAAQVLADKAGGPLFLVAGLGRPPNWKLPAQYAALHPPAEIRLPPEITQPPGPLPAIALEKRPDRDARPGGVERPAAAGEERLRAAVASQHAYASWLDAQIGVLLAALDRAKLWDTSAVVLVGDGGPYLWSHGMVTRSDLLFDETLRTPLIVAAPGLPRPGAATAQIVELVDVYPTLVELAGLPPVKRLEGTSLAPVLADPERPVKTAAFSVVRRTAGQLGRSVRTARFRYTEWPDGSEELYDHEKDPGELTNLALRPDHTPTLAELKKRLGETGAAAVQAPAEPAQRPQRARKPNVLLIVADDMTARLGCYGYDVVTPHMDRLARMGRRFERAYCQVAICSPSRTSFLTGRRPERLGIWDNLEPPKPRLEGAVPLHEHFKAHGYFTARVGKLFHQAFDPEFKWDVAEHAPQSTEQEEEDQEPRQRRTKRRGELDAASWSVPTDRPDEQEPDGLRARRAAQLIEEHKDRPFFIALGFAKPHLRWVAPRKYFDLYSPERMRVPDEPADDFADIPVIAIEHDALEHPGRLLPGPPGADVPRGAALAGYSAAVSFVDAQLGVVLDTLDRLQLWDDTIVVLTGDHGFQLGEHGGLFRKDTLFEEALRVPLLVWAPGLAKPGTPTSSLAELIDLYPTLTDLAGLPRPKGLAGTSLAPILQDPARSVKTAAFSAARRRPPPLGWSIRTERYRYTEWPDGSRELYDHQTDPGERANLAGSPAQSRTLAELRQRLEDGWRPALVKR